LTREQPLALAAQAGFSRLPYGWAHDRFALPVTLACGQRQAELRSALDQLFWGQPEEFLPWFRAFIDTNLPAFEQAAILADVEEIESFAATHRNGKATSNQLALL